MTRVDRALGVAGYLADRSEFDRLLVAEDLGARADELSGVFGLFRASEQGFSAVTSLVRVAPVYHACSGSVQLAGNSALMVHLVAGLIERGDEAIPAVSYDLPALQSLARNGFFMSDDTPFAGVQALPAHASLDTRDGRAVVRTRPIPEPARKRPGLTARRQQVRDLADSLIAAVLPIRPSAGVVRISLTGGRDSRLIAAALRAIGAPFRATTQGFPDHPDVVIAGQICRLFALRHDIQPPQLDDDGKAVEVPHPLDRACHVLRLADGALSAHNSIQRAVPYEPAPKLAGIGGEQLRGGFLTNQADLAPRAIRRRLTSLFAPRGEFMTGAANDRARSDMAPWVEQARRDGLRALDLLYLYYRTGRWAAASHSAGLLSRNLVYPLLDNRVTRRALAMSALWRWSEEPIHLVITRLAPELRDLPLTGRRWRYEESGPPSFLRRHGWSARGALQPVSVTGRFDWRMKPDGHLVSILREHILDGPPTLFELVVREKVEELLATTPLQQPKFVWDVFTVSVLLSGAWLNERAPLPAIRVAVA